MPTAFTGHPQPPRKTVAFAPPMPSPSIHEGILGKVAEDDPTRLLTQGAIAGARHAAEKSRAACAAIHLDSTLSEGGRHVMAASVAEKVIKACLPLLTKATQNLETQIGLLTLKTSGPPKDTSISGHMVAAELRSLLASMTSKDRLAAIAKSLNENDDSLAASALHGSRFLTGLSALEQEHVRQMWATKRQPEAVAKLKVLEGDREHLSRSGNLLLGFQTKLYDRNIVEAATKHQEAARAAIAAATA